MDAAQEAIGYVEGIPWEEFAGSRPLQHSVVRCIEIIGEASSRVSKGLRDANPQIPWADIIGMRNRVVHASFDIDIAVVWKTATEDLPALLPNVAAIVQGLTQRK
ncbi:MAG: DUF86 domain-containing protein [Candidatus Hydrogenedentes bacterium]|nr:DUF86 domain-containing protein [Candidatus Hydrogenedentota bacterium]